MQDRIRNEKGGDGFRPPLAHLPAQRSASLAGARHGGVGPVAAILALQRAAGNSAVTRALAAQRHAADDGCEEHVQRRMAAYDVLGMPGRPLSRPQLHDMEAPFGGVDLSDVRIHDNAAAKKSAQEIGARDHISGSDSGTDTPATRHTAQRAMAGHAGPALTVQRRKPSANAPTEHYAAKAQEHPEWAVFQKMMQQGGFPADVIESAWQLLLGGVLEQEELNRLSSDESIDPAERRKVRASNTWYRELVNLVGDHLKITTPTLALWSGGFDVSVYAHGKGHTSLEFTRLGKVVDQLELHANWKLQAPLWNVLSTAFVERATGPVHVFLRAYNPDSVLIAQEIPQLRLIQRLNPAVTLTWHPLYTTPDGKIKEISEDLQLTGNAEYRSRDKCVSVMYDYLMRFHDESNSKASMAYAEMNELLDKNVNPKAGEV